MKEKLIISAWPHEQKHKLEASIMLHKCHAIGCEKEVPPSMFTCRDHWYMLSAPLRKRIWSTYKSGQEVRRDPSKEYMAAATEAQLYIAWKEGKLSPEAAERTKAEYGWK